MSATGVLIRQVRLGVGDEGRYDVVVRDGVIAGVIPAVQPGRTHAGVPPETVDGSGCALLPGLVDHHLHLGAWLRSQRSAPLLDAGVAASLAAAEPDRRGWRVVFGLDHQHDLAAALSAVDAQSGPCLVVHRTGHASLLNAAAASALGIGTGTTMDHGRGRWGAALGPADPDWEADRLRALADDLLAQGVVAVQDATPYPASAAARCDFLRAALAPIRLDFMADADRPLPGARWIKLFSSAAPATTALPLAVHAVEPAEILTALDLLRSLASGPDCPHRIEHAALCPPAVLEQILGCLVCANPGFLLERAAAFGSLATTGEDEFLHPVADLHDAGVALRFGSDAPVTRPGVWSAFDAACRRGGPAVPFAGRAMAPGAAIEAVVAYPVPAEPADWIGRPADLALIDDRRLTGSPGDGPAARATFVGGVPVFRA